MRKGENANNQHFLLHSQCFLPFPNQITIFHPLLFSANAFNLDQSKDLLFGKELKIILKKNLKALWRKFDINLTESFVEFKIVAMFAHFRILKPFIRRDYDSRPLKMKLLQEIKAYPHRYLPCNLDFNDFNPLPHSAAFCVENIVRKGEIACSKQFLLFSQCFPPYMALILHFKCTLKCHLQFVSFLTSLKVLSSGDGLKRKLLKACWEK